MSEERLDGLHCYQNININFDNGIDKLEKLNRRNDIVLWLILFGKHLYDVCKLFYVYTVW